LLGPELAVANPTAEGYESHHSGGPVWLEVAVDKGLSSSPWKNGLLSRCSQVGEVNLLAVEESHSTNFGLCVSPLLRISDNAEPSIEP